MTRTEPWLRRRHENGLCRLGALPPKRMTASWSGYWVSNRIQGWGLSGNSVLEAVLVSSLDDEAFAEDDGELRFGLDPFTRRPFPVRGGVVQNEI